jgi:2-polyprenyl-6-methoxyphenol hydroxylase-like FAD-dependent oxidoreductase/2-polyprenyl-3-methyl-5-hydroxy-6-metoxy-1,4-benzoquinol methylase
LSADQKPDADVLIVGGGPVGLLLAGLLGKSGRSVMLIESSSGVASRSMAIGITPPSLQILDTLGLAESFINKGVVLRHAYVHEGNRPIGQIRFDRGNDRYSFIVIHPQSQTMCLLRDYVSAMKNVRLLYGWKITGMSTRNDTVLATARNLETSEENVFCASLAAACDGARGAISAMLGIQKKFHAYQPVFTMMDFTDRSPLGRDAHVFFGPERPVESFPLPGGCRRWIVRSGWIDRGDLSDSFEAAIARLTGITLDIRDRRDESNFQPQWAIAKQFYRGRVVLCGDAAHVMSPIGGQGMNTGFADAYVLAGAFDSILQGDASPERTLKQFERLRKTAFIAAARRAAMGMTLGVWKGRIQSAARRFVISNMLNVSFTHYALARCFSMTSLPHPVKQREKLMQQCRATPRWPDLSHRWSGVELMDDPNGDETKLLNTIHQFRMINKLVSRYRSILNRHVVQEMMANPDRHYHLIDLGAGGCDIAVWLLARAKRLRLKLKITAIDGDARTVHYAKSIHGHVGGLFIHHADILTMDQFGPADYVFSNHVLHHLPDAMIPSVLQKVHAITSRRWIISDLHRSMWAYNGFQLLGRFFRDSYSLEDGKRSIRRGFIPSDIMNYANAAGLAGQVQISRLLPGRILVMGSRLEQSV